MDDELEQSPAQEEAPGMTSPGQIPAATGEIDPRDRVRQYLQMQMARRDRMDSPEAVGARADNQNRMDQVRDNTAFAGLLMNSAAKFGNIAGKTPDTSGMDAYTKQINQNMGDYQQRMAMGQAQDAANQDKQTKLYQYLSDMQRQQNAEKTSQYNAETKRRLSEAPDWQQLQGRDSEGYAVERNKKDGTTRRVPGIAPEKEKTILQETNRTDDAGNPLLFNPKTGTYTTAGAGIKPKPDKGKDKPKVPAGEAINLGGYESIDNTIDSLGGSFDQYAGGKSGLQRTMSYLGSGLPGTTSDAAKYNQEARRAAQAIGTVLEKGKLTDADYIAKYVPMMPSWGDSEELKRAKLEGLKEYARQKQHSELNALTQAGYATDDFKSLPPFTKSAADKPVNSGTAQAAPAFKPLHQMTTEEKLKELQELTGGQ